MKNKFEALQAFMDWPQEWQKLCAEFWMESDQPDEPKASAWTNVDKIATSSNSMQAETVLPKSVGKSWSISEQECLVKCLAETKKLRDAVEMFVTRYPQRSRDAVRRRAWGMKCGELKPEVNYS